MAEKEKPMCPIIGANGNIFNILGIASRTLKDNGMAEEAQEMYNRAISSGSYDEALCIITDYITPCSQEEMGLHM
ncbi:MAG: hypothetical protein K5979_05075 [Ruminococcus sp.]|jgi:hypothetical protein|nr:hypothetical protein [Ruminococcus sp.]